MHENDGRVVSNFIVQALQNRPITLYGDGCQTRSFCYVDDLIDGMVRMMESPVDLTGPVNLGNPNELTIRELAETIIEMTGSSSELIFLPLPADDPKRRQPNIDKASEELGWKPNVPLRQGLEKTIEYFDQLLNERGLHG